ncbi:MAG: PSD1 and planctomycete cytochrome C domain-containing protein [Leadbetterella sp.]
MKFKSYLFLAILSVFGLVALQYTISSCGIGKAQSSNSQDVDYNFHIRPILSDKCFHCHGPDANKREANLRLDTETGAYAALKDNPKLHAIVKGDSKNSEVFKRIMSEDSEAKMPPPNSNLSLTDSEKDLIKKWIDQGAKYQKHWAFLPIKKTEIPEADEDWTHNPIDNFVFAKMKEKGLSPSEQAEKETLLKRVSFDLTGLPPSVELQEKFLADKSEDAYKKIVIELLKNKHYGERMALNWLDVARYADSHGYQDDGMRTMWPWRDWVIHAFNSNYSYKKFITWQLAGDIIAEKAKNDTFKKEMILATGFNRNHKITQEGGVIDEEYRVEYVSDRTNTFGKSMIALTLECSKCHDHKFDPISQKEYFGVSAFFNHVPEKGFFGHIDASFADPPNMNISKKDVDNILKFINLKDTASVNVMVMKDDTSLRKTYVLNRGNYDDHGPEVDYSLPVSVKAFKGYTKNRYGLSQWMFAEDNPLTARVYVNRIWQQIFGRGIVKTVGDFGMQGELPTHPELLDWLAKDFSDNDWNIKRLIFQIVTSATYMQSSDVKEDHTNKDPENIYLSRASRIRFPAEIVKDHVLASSGLLNPEIGGPSVKTYQPKGIWEVATSGRGSLATYVQDHGNSLYRRGMYTFIKRTVPPPSMLIFDSSNRDQCEVNRTKTNTPLQALVMLNDPHVIECASYLALYAQNSNKSKEELINEVFQKIICRKPKSEETSLLLDYFEKEEESFAKNTKASESLLKVGEFKKLSPKNKAQFAAYLQCFRLVYNMEEAITRI